MAVLMVKVESAQFRVLVLHNYMDLYIRGCGYATPSKHSQPLSIPVCRTNDAGYHVRFSLAFFDCNRIFYKTEDHI